MRQVGFVFFLLVLFSCQKTSPSLCDSDKELKDIASFPIGTTEDDVVANWTTAIGGKYFNRITSENVLKMDRLAQSPDSFDFFPLAKMSREANNAGYEALHVHTVIWHKQLPQWISNYPSQELDDVLTRYCREYAKAISQTELIRITGIDVVNEALNEDGTYRNNLWFQSMGRNYILKAFREFSSLDPNFKLFYNDFNLALNPIKLDAALDLCDWLRSQGVRVDGIGTQMHINIHEPSANDLAQAFEKIISRGYEVHVSELDISINPYNKIEASSDKLLQQQAEKFHEVFRLYSELPKKYQYGITLWGIGDGDSWIPTEFKRFDAPLVFDQNYSKKPAYCSCLRALEK